MNIKIQHIGIADGMENDPTFPAVTTEPDKRNILVRYATDHTIIQVLVTCSELESVIIDLVENYGAEERDIEVSIKSFE